MSHSPKGLGSLLIKPSRWAGQALAAIPVTGQFGSKAHERAEGVLSHSQEEASSTNPASQSQTSHIKTHRGVLSPGSGRCRRDR
jgi:hypothetical protein